MQTIEVVAKQSPAHVQTDGDKYEVRMYGYLVQTFDNEVDAIERMHSEAKGEKRYAYK